MLEYLENETQCDELALSLEQMAHHGHREWGSPVMPKTKAAWLLHLCDNISARMHDADKWDFVNKG